MHLLKMFTLYRVYEAILVHSCVRPKADIAHTADPLTKAPLMKLVAHSLLLA